MRTRPHLPQRFLMFVLIVILSFICAACATPTPVPTVGEPLEYEILASALTADGRVIPQEWVQLSFSASGIVSEVVVKSGDLVKKNDVLARLGNRQAAEAAVSAAQLELLLAEQAYQALTDQLKVEQLRALQSLYDARQAVNGAENRLEYWQGSTVEADADLADAQVIQAEDRLETAQENYEDYKDEDRDDLNRVRFLEELANAQLAYDNAIRQYESLVDSGKEFNLDQARSALIIAQDQLEQAQEQYDEISKGPDPKAVATAEARQQAAQSQLVAAQANLEALTLRAVIDGEVMGIHLKVGEQVVGGSPVIWLADISQWLVETDNLTEIDVVEIGLGQKVEVVVDALPEITFAGEVLSIEQIYKEQRGDITYTANILMEGSDPRLRWGMTCAVTFLNP